MNTFKVSLIALSIIAGSFATNSIANLAVPQQTLNEQEFINAIKAKKGVALDLAGIKFKNMSAPNLINESITYDKYKDTGNTLLHIAVLEGYPYAIKKLLSLGADPNIKNNEGKTPVDLATEKGPVHLLPIFLEAAHAKK